MGPRVILIIVILLSSYLPTIESVSAQWFPAVDLECQAVHPSGNLEINVTPDSNGSDYADCTVSNPNMYQEKISIMINAGTFASAGPADFYVEANSEVDFQVFISCSECGSMNQTQELMIVAEVVEANGLPPPTNANSESNLLVDIIVYEESNETEKIILEKTDNQSLIYAGGGGAVLLLLILFAVMKKRKQMSLI
tara:strand:+ start:2276 stop:2863 length:588 start_codon:yes stop_codon:yes gene_type:complete